MFNSVIRSVVPVKNFGHNVNVILTNTNVVDLLVDLYESDPDNKYNMNKNLTSEPEKFKSLSHQNIRILSLNEYDKKIVKNACHFKSVNYVIGDTIPIYIGLFPEMKDLNEILELEAMNDMVTQSSPLHVTLEYLGGKLPEEKQNYEEKYPFGKIFSIKLIGASDNEAGLCLVVELPDNITHVNESIPHITFATNKGFTPADVGKKIDPNKIVKFNQPYSVHAVLSATF